ncbi:hypothetical protein [Cupriavidus pauculus]|uniref:hypothetical protein n=1 Tax=Cupriavidus pauculus TaxID=82633 RepID=UPI001EE32BAA|nr:hypothetical protein [Cupriavidus pauculus]GJG93881.1 hypothetical protein CBA19C6_05350 [Cupriavidus pauculus]
MKRIKPPIYPWQQEPLFPQKQKHHSLGVPVTSEMYLKIQWIINNKPGYRSMRAFAVTALSNEIERTLAELDIK